MIFLSLESQYATSY